MRVREVKMMERERMPMLCRRAVELTTRGRSDLVAHSPFPVRYCSGNPDFDIIYGALQGVSGRGKCDFEILSGEIESRVTARTCSFSVNVETSLESDMSCEGRAMADYSAGRVLCTHVFSKGFRRPTLRTRVKRARPLYMSSTKRRMA